MLTRHDWLGLQSNQAAATRKLLEYASGHHAAQRLQAVVRGRVDRRRMAEAKAKAEAEARADMEADARAQTQAAALEWSQRGPSILRMR